MICFFIGSNSSVLSSNASSLTSNNGVGNQMALTNVTNTSSNPAVLNSSHAPTTHRSMTKTVSSTEPGRIPPDAGKGLSTPIAPTKVEKSVSEEPESTKPVVRVVSSPANPIDDEGNVYSFRKYPDPLHRGTLCVMGLRARGQKN